MKLEISKNSKKNIRIYFSYSILILLTNCDTLKKRPSVNDTSLTSIENSYCDQAIQTFNNNSGGNIQFDIEAIFSKRGSIPDDLRNAYPAARNKWNNSLRDVRKNYANSATYIENNLDNLTIEQIKDWRNQNLEDYHVFFILLTEYAYGKFPEGTHATMEKEGWIEKADPKKRMEANVKNIIISNCTIINAESVRQMINPKLLPNTLEELYLD